MVYRNYVQAHICLFIKMMIYLMKYDISYITYIIICYKDIKNTLNLQFT